MSEPRISVILPVYNGSRYLRESIHSVLAQSFDDFELLICDDGSTDSSREIVASYDDRHVRAIYNPQNVGLFSTLNLLVEHSRGEFIRFWAQDDRMSHECLATERAFWKEHPNVALTYCARNTIDESGAVVSEFAGDPTPEVIFSWLTDQIAFYHGCLQGNISTVCVRRDVLRAAGPFAPMRFAADFDMWMRISAVHPIGFIRKPLVYLRAHSEQLSRSSVEWPFYLSETRGIFESIFERLPAELKEHARKYDTRRRTVTTVHHIMRLLLAGSRERSKARSLFAELSRNGSSTRQILVWALTANGRFFSPRPRFQKPALSDEPSSTC